MQRPAGGVGIGDDDGAERLAEGGLDGGLPAGVDAHEVEQRAEHAVDAGEAFGAGPGAGRVERELQRLDPRRQAGRPLGGALALGDAVGVGAVGGGERRLGPLELDDERPRRARSHSRQSAVQAGDLGGELGAAVGVSSSARRRARAISVSARSSAGLARPQLAADLGDGARRAGLRHRVEQRQHALALGGELLLGQLEVEDLGVEGVDVGAHDGQLGGEAGGVALQAGDDVGVEQLAAVALQRPAALDDDRADAPAALAQLLDEAQAVADVVGAAGRQLGAGRRDLGVEAGQRRPSARPPARRRRASSSASAVSFVRSAGDLAAGDEDPQRRQLADQLAVAAGRLGLALERAQLAADLAEQVLDAQQVGLGGVEAALGLLLALAELEDAGGLLDDRPAVLGAGVEDGVDLALADDDVLLAADAGVGEQLLHVEQAARHVVDGVLAVAAAEQRAADRDLGELDRQDAGRVVERQRDLGAAERRRGWRCRRR